MKSPLARRRVSVLVCDDSAFLRVTLRRVIESDEELVVADVARNGEEAVEKAIRLKPDVITMDLHMPVVDGITALKDIVRLKIAPVIMLSASTTEDAQVTMDAMEAGAFDFIPKPSEVGSLETQAAEITRKLKQAAASDLYGKWQYEARSPVQTPGISVSPGPPISSATGGQGFKAVVVGLSTGGPRAIYQVLPYLPAGLNAAVFVVQHMPTAFIGTFTQRLARKTALECIESSAGMKVEPRKIYVATGGYHLKLVQPRGGDIRIRQTKEPRHVFMPSVDVTMHSVCDIFAAETIGVLMTGMGRDGAEAMARIVKTGGATIVESEETAVVFGMPQEAIKRGGAQRVVPNWAIAAEIINAIGGENPRPPHNPQNP